MLEIIVYCYRKENDLKKDYSYIAYWQIRVLLKSIGSPR